MPREFFTVDSFVDVVSDPIGAGDALLAYASLALRATDSIVIAAILGSIAAAVECERQGNLPVTPAEVEQKIGLLEKLANYT
jgi:sugar/nucleoside kinase (ribokinase family)